MGANTRTHASDALVALWEAGASDAELIALAQRLGSHLSYSLHVSESWDTVDYYPVCLCTGEITLYCDGVEIAKGEANADFGFVRDDEEYS
ncbi:MAG: hypothetical protein SNJ84_08955, partial [Verrucomicrobiia bacterium]